MKILGISALYHDSAAALISDGNIVVAAQEERFSRIKHDKRLPLHAIKFCLSEGNINFSELDAIVYYDNPFLTVQRFCANVCSLGNKAENLINRSFDDLTGEKVWVKQRVEEIFGKVALKTDFLVAKHHLSHAASAFYPSPYDEALILTNDGVGEWDTTTIGYGTKNNIKILKTIHYPHSLGLLYSAFTYLCGFKVNEGDYKFMGLAPYGEPVYYDLIKEKIIDVKSDGSYRLNLRYFDYQNGKTMISQEMEELFGKKRRQPESKITKHEMDIAASVQKITEEIIVKQAKYAKSIMPHINNLVLAGGCALNCVANGVLLRENIFENVWIQPAAGDAGGALGAALYAYYGYYKNERVAEPGDAQKGSYLGSEYSDYEIEKQLQEFSAVFHKSDHGKREKKIASLLAKGNIIGLFQGRAEFGPRALGNRSIIADPRSETMQSKMNLKIKFRESFRPFAPSVLAEKASEYFELNIESPYMLLCADVKKERRYEFSLKKQLEYSDMDMLPIVNSKRSDIPAVTHVDYSARIQTVDKKRNEKYYNIIKAFEEETGCSVIINTSFNVRGEPIVNSPKDAYICFMRTDMDVLVIEDYILYKNEQPPFTEDKDWRDQYELD
ncbi:MAG: carbamoyltransferase [Lachnospiraceae bacterium]|nr:carbamoyltransferase [Lachnospiraceae bacterium]